MKCIPISKNPETRDGYLDTVHFESLKKIPEDGSEFQILGVKKFRQLVDFTAEVADDKVIEKYHQYWQKYFKDTGNHAVFVAKDDSDEIVGFVWVGEAFFNEKIAMIYDFVVHDSFKQKELEKQLVKIAENWTKEKGFSRFYMLLHTKQDITLDTCKELGLQVPGYFMEKKLK